MHKINEHNMFIIDNLCGAERRKNAYLYNERKHKWEHIFLKENKCFKSMTKIFPKE